MKVTDERTGEIVVTRDWARSAVELHVGSTAADSTRILRLTGEEARRLAALILFQFARLERPRATPAHAESERESAQENSDPGRPGSGHRRPENGMRTSRGRSRDAWCASRSAR